MLESALFRQDRIPGYVLYLALNRLPFEIGEMNSVAGNDCKIAIAQEKQVARVIENRRNVRGHEIFIFPEADDGGRAIARGNDLVWIVDGDDGKRKHAGKLRDGFADCIFQRRAMTVRRLQEVVLD